MMRGVRCGIELVRGTPELPGVRQAFFDRRTDPPLHACVKMRTRSDEVTLLQTVCAQPQTGTVQRHLHAIGV
jgi:hypothetical protein